MNFSAKHNNSRRATLKNTPWIKLTPLSDPRQALAYTGLDKGEAEVLALALEKSASLVVIDEQKGRRYANRIGVRLTGTLGVLLTAKERGLIPTIAPLVNQLLATGLFLSSAIVEKALKIAGER